MSPNGFAVPNSSFLDENIVIQNKSGHWLVVTFQHSCSVLCTISRVKRQRVLHHRRGMMSCCLLTS